MTLMIIAAVTLALLVLAVRQCFKPAVRLCVERTQRNEVCVYYRRAAWHSWPPGMCESNAELEPFEVSVGLIEHPESDDAADRLAEMIRKAKADLQQATAPSADAERLVSLGKKLIDP